MPADRKFDAVWMSQFLDCFSEEQIVSILRRAAKVMDSGSRLYIMAVSYTHLTLPTTP